MLEALMKKKDEPDTPPHGRSFNINVDLSDPKQVEQARKLGLSDLLFGDDDDDDDTDPEPDPDEGPRRRGYFKEA